MTQDRIEVPADDDALLAECRVETFRAGGPGGQHQNKTDSAVRLVHLPSGVTVVARAERSQYRNRTRALARLREKLEKLNEVVAPRKKTGVPRSSKKKRLEEKRRRGDRKRGRRPPGADDDS